MGNERDKRGEEEERFFRCIERQIGRKEEGKKRGIVREREGERGEARRQRINLPISGRQSQLPSSSLFLPFDLVLLCLPRLPSSRLHPSRKSSNLSRPGFFLQRARSTLIRGRNRFEHRQISILVLEINVCPCTWKLARDAEVCVINIRKISLVPIQLDSDPRVHYWIRGTQWSSPVNTQYRVQVSYFISAPQRFDSIPFSIRFSRDTVDGKPLPIPASGPRNSWLSAETGSRGHLYRESIGDLMLENCKPGTVTSNDRGNGNVDDVCRVLDLKPTSRHGFCNQIFLDSTINIFSMYV